VIIATVGGLTAVVCALIGLVQSDIKKVIAFSTCSQLGYMTLSCGLSLYDVGLFHLFTHAIFKALLFLSAGGIIHSMLDEQSLLKYGSLIS
jgi:NADH-quinone oxidoreductase subunit L